ncbi:MAG: class II aldolase/adducin family protein [Pseudomonadota bacterium]
MADQEGVIKFRLRHRFSQACELDYIRQLNPWRSILYRLGLIGQDPVRYDGLGFGNISQRLTGTGKPTFIISGTQTGGKPQLIPEDYTVVFEADPQRNVIESKGPIKPSSEALTHAAVYDAAPHVRCVIHVHCPEIWQSTRALMLPSTTSEIGYGTPEMAHSVSRLFKTGQLDRINVFTMLGHEDGVVAFGETAEAASLELIRHLALAFSVG